MEEKLSAKIIRLVEQKSAMNKTVRSNDFSFEKTRKNQILPLNSKTLDVPSS
jgi:hypothetical protein